jgi:site-specific DNA-methyltransferase (adenine-specific)
VTEEKGDKSRPLSVWNKLIEHHSYLDDTVIDPFVGTGTTIFACEETGRFCRAMEISEEKCELIVKRAQCLGMKCKEL